MKEMIRHKFSLHPTDKSPTGENSFHVTTTFADHSETHSFIQTAAVRDNRFQALYERTVLDPRNLEPVQPAEKDTVIYLPSFDPARFTLHYIVWVTSAEAIKTFQGHPSYQAVGKWFKRFSVIVACGFTRQPSSAGGMFKGHSTSRAEDLTPEDIAAGCRPGPAPGAPAETTAGMTVLLLNDVIRLPIAGSWDMRPYGTKGLVPSEEPLFMPFPIG
jgi:hypothetical protein